MSEKQVKYQHGDVLIRPTDNELDDILAKDRFGMLKKSAVSLDGGSNWMTYWRKTVLVC